MVAFALPPEVPEGYETIPPAQIKRTLAAMQAWLDREAAARLTPEVRRPRELFRRAVRLLIDVARRTERSAWDTTDRIDLGRDAPHNQVDRLIETWDEEGPLAEWVLGPAGRVGPGGPAEPPPAPTDPVAAAAVTYLRAALDGHPLLDDLGRHMPNDRQEELIEARAGADLPAGEAAALRALRAALWKAAGLPGEAPPPEKAPPPAGGAGE